MKRILPILLLLAGPAAAQTKTNDADGVYSNSGDRTAKKGNPTAGQEAQQPFRGANTIIIHTTDSTSLAFRLAGRAVVNAGYSPTEKYNDLLYLLTAFRPMSNGGSIRVSIRVSVQPEPSGAAILFTGTLANAVADMLVNGATPMTGRVEYRGKFGPWHELARVAALCPGTSIGYAYRP